MPLSWNEIRDRALTFSKEWADVEKENAEYQSFWDGFFNVFGIRRRSVALYQEKVKKLSGTHGFIDLFWPGTLLVEHKSAGENLDSAYVQATDYINVTEEQDRPRYIIVSDYKRFRLYDLEADTPTEQVTECSLSELSKNVRVFGFIAGYSKKIYKNEEAVNVKAAGLAAGLHDALYTTGYRGHELEMLLVRLVFCFFADDTDIFGEHGAFSNFIETKTSEDGSDLGPRLAQIFQILNTPKDKRQTIIDEELRDFPYVDGHLFEEQLPLPSFDTKMRAALLKCSTFDWGVISPAVFGAMFQSAMDPTKRHELGAHYTSEKNIMKVISGLFLEDLKTELKKIGNHPAKLNAFHDKIAGMKFLDPACGCGNFLVVTYRELRLLELEILRRLFAHAMKGLAMPDVTALAKIDIDSMYGIEIEELPANIASLALWLTDHQMNMRLSLEFGHYYARLPLTKSPTIVRGNALRLDWNTIVPKEKLSYIFGNPPFVSKQDRNEEQKNDMEYIFGELKGAGELDFVAAWYPKSADYIQGTDIGVAFVSTNSITQGEQISILWSYLIEKGIKINFAHRTFKWTNEARGKAAVFCVIIGFALQDTAYKRIYDYETPTSEPHELIATQINPYLIDSDDILVSARRKPLCPVPHIVFGSMPNDGGHLILEAKDRDEIIAEYPNAEEFIKPFLGAKEFLNGEQRWCLWLKNANPDQLRQYSPILRRIEGVREHRLKSRRDATNKLAETPSLFGEDRQPDKEFVLIPCVSSEMRRYVPMAFFSQNFIAGNSCVVVPGATLYHFGVLQSLMHMAWMRLVCGRMKGDYRYSNELVYNNFPWPDNPEERLVAAVEAAAKAVLDIRKEFIAATLADLYDPNTMPEKLLKAHKTLDAAVDRCYETKKFDTELDRLKFLFGIYKQLIENSA